MKHEDQKYYEELHSLFGHPGFKYLIKDITEYRKHLEESWPSLDTADEFFQAKGGMYALNYLLSYEEATRANYDMLLRMDK